MIGQDAPSGGLAFTQSDSCYFFHFGLIVTGKGEREHLPKLFRSLSATGICNFEVIRRIGQRSPIRSVDRQIRMVGRGKIIPTKDEEEIGLPARRHLEESPCCFAILVDDLEYSRRDQAHLVFDRYRSALDTMLTPSQKPRASVHFLVNMLEAYYFADAKAINSVLCLEPQLDDNPDDVEEIRHPKNKLRGIHPGFREVDDGGRILDQIDAEHVLSRPDTCAWLRTLFAWCARVLERYPDFGSLDLALSDKYHLSDGALSEITRSQLDSL